VYPLVLNCLNEASKNTGNALIEWLWKDTTKYFPKIKVNVVSMCLSYFSELFLEHFLSL
jgi:hypothetical protein